MTSVIKLDTVESTSGATAFIIDSSGNISASGNININGAVTIGSQQPIHIVELETPAIVQVSFSGTVYSSLTINAIPVTARYAFADVFITASSSDHQNFELGRNSMTAQKNWVDVRGQIPTGQFGNNARHVVTLTNPGESDGYTPNYGTWYSSQLIPTAGQIIYYNNYGNSGSAGYIYIRVKGYSL